MTNIQSFINLQDWLSKIRQFSDHHVQIALVGNKSDLVAESDRQNNYGRYALRSTYSEQVLDTEEDNEKSNKSGSGISRKEKKKRQNEIETIMKNLSIKQQKERKVMSPRRVQQ